MDVDVTIGLGTRMDFYALEKSIQEQGFQNAIEGRFVDL